MHCLMLHSSGCSRRSGGESALQMRSCLSAGSGRAKAKDAHAPGLRLDKQILLLAATERGLRNMQTGAGWARVGT
eukprot:scaffold6021_cov117-Isochrysis_galbana.AAC.22